MTARDLLVRLVVEVPLDAEPAAEGRAAEPFDLPDPRPGPLDAALGADLRRRLRLALDALPPAASAVVRLRYGFAASGHCWPRSAIAALLGVEEPRLARLEGAALADLRTLLHARPRGTARAAPRASAPKKAHRSRRRSAASACVI